jgi:hypothetical protein
MPCRHSDVGLLQNRYVLARVLDLVGRALLDDVLDLVEDRLERRMLDDVQLLRLHESSAFLVEDRRVHLAQTITCRPERVPLGM